MIGFLVGGPKRKSPSRGLGGQGSWGFRSWEQKAPMIVATMIDAMITFHAMRNKLDRRCAYDDLSCSCTPSCSDGSRDTRLISDIGLRSPFCSVVEQRSE